MDNEESTTVAHGVQIEHLKEQQGRNTDSIRKLYDGQNTLREDVSEVKTKVEIFAKHVDECSDEKRFLRKVIVWVGSVIAAGTGVSGHDEAISIFQALTKSFAGM